MYFTITYIATKIEVYFDRSKKPALYLSADTTCRFFTDSRLKKNIPRQEKTGTFIC